MKKTVFKTNEKENFKSKLNRFIINFFPAYRRTGARIYFLSGDWKEIHIRLGLNWKTRNYVGSVFGGSIYGALDPLYMIQLMKILGKNYVVWDKSATIKFLKPIKKNVYARFLITSDILTKIITKVKAHQRYSVDLSINFQDENGIIYAEVIKTLYIADKDYYKTRNEKKQE
jgi:acyl-coenzyme A thioesterase PaaI-like protein